MFGSIGGGEILLILALALLLFGPRKLPQIGKTLGKTLAEFRRATHDLKHNLEQEVRLEELNETRRGLQAAGQEIREAVNEANPLGVARGDVHSGKPRSTSADSGADEVAETSRATDVEATDRS